ncbi:MAG: papain-like cysteine protease family protein [Candidatus Nanoarchaeia archaeon]|nr:papain-like cysteine protease family protein [Candidatus Nanoarchaeia archaeon]
MSSKKTPLEDKIHGKKLTGGRKLLAICGLGAAISAAGLPPKEANAELYCYPDMFNPYVEHCTAAIDTSIIYSEAESVTQNASQWCWAASIEMVFAYYGHDVSQDRIVQNTWGGLVDYPGSPWQIMQNLNKEWTDNNGDTFQAQGDSYSASVYAAAHDLASDHPLIIGAFGHATVLTSMSYARDVMTGAWVMESATVLDPWPGRGERFVSAYEWTSINFAARVRAEAF